MAQVTMKSNSTEPLGGPNLGVGSDQGDSWNTTVANLNTMLTELYTRTGGASTLAANVLQLNGVTIPNPTNNFRNVIDGGDFSINPWQRGTSFSNIAATLTYTADRFFLVGTDASVSGRAARAAFSNVAGFNQAFRFGRAANASSLSAIVVGQIMETADSIRLQGQPVALSFWAASEANFSAAGGNITAALVYGTGTDQSAASAVAGSWTGQANVFSALQAINSTMTRYTIAGTVPTSATQVGLLLNYVPVGSAGPADTVLLQGIQLEVGPSASLFEHRDAEVELALCQRYCFVASEPTSGVVVGAGQIMQTNKAQAIIALPTPMRIAPTVTVNAGAFVWRFNGADQSWSGLAAGATHTVNAISVVASGNAASNFAAMLQGGNGSGSIIANSDY